MGFNLMGGIAGVAGAAQDVAQGWIKNEQTLDLAAQEAEIQKQKIIALEEWKLKRTNEIANAEVTRDKGLIDRTLTGLKQETETPSTSYANGAIAPGIMGREQPVTRTVASVTDYEENIAIAKAFAAQGLTDKAKQYYDIADKFKPKEKKFHNVNAGDTVLDEAGNEVYKAAPKPAGIDEQQWNWAIAQTKGDAGKAMVLIAKSKQAPQQPRQSGETETQFNQYLQGYIAEHPEAVDGKGKIKPSERNKAWKEFKNIGDNAPMDTVTDEFDAQGKKIGSHRSRKVPSGVSAPAVFDINRFLK